MELYPLNEHNAKEAEDKPPHEVSADDPESDIVASVFLGNERNPIANAQIYWTIERDPKNIGPANGTFVESGSSEATTETDDFGFSVVTFKGTTVAGDKFVVKAHLLGRYGKGKKSHTSSGPYQIAPGQTAKVTFDPLVFIPAEGQQFQVFATLQDQYNNKVADETPVSWFDSGLTSLVDDGNKIKTTTKNGRVNAWFQVGAVHEGEEGSPPSVVLEADGFQQPKDLSFTPFSVELQFVSPNTSDTLDVALEQSGTLIATFAHPDGTPFPDGVPVFWYTSKGTISGASTVTSGGTAQATLNSAGATPGTAAVAVTIGTGGGIGAAGSVEFFSSAAGWIAAEGYLTSDDPSNYGNMGIHGPPNGYAVISQKDTILASYPFSNDTVTTPLGQAYPDVINGHLAYVMGSPTKSHAINTYETDPSLLFNGPNDALYILSEADLLVRSGLVLNVWIRPTGLPTSGNAMVIIGKAGEYELAFINDGGKYKIRFSVNLSGTWRILYSDPLSLMIPTFAIQAVFTGKALQLIVNGGVTTLFRTGLITVGTSPIGVAAKVTLVPGLPPQLANLFNGYIDDIVIARRISLASGLGTIPLGPTGFASVPVQQDGPFLTPEPDDILAADADWSKHKFQLNVRIYGPSSPPDEPVLDDDVDFIQVRRHHMRMFINSLGEPLHTAAAIIRAIVRGGLALDDVRFLASLPTAHEIDFKKTTFAICNVLWTYLSLLTGGLTIIAKMGKGLNLFQAAGKASLVLSRIARTAVYLKQGAEIGQFAELLDAVREKVFGDEQSAAKLQDIAPSKRSLQTIQRIAKLDNPNLPPP